MLQGWAFIPQCTLDGHLARHPICPLPLAFLSLATWGSQPAYWGYLATYRVGCIGARLLRIFTRGGREVSEAGVGLLGESADVEVWSLQHRQDPQCCQFHVPLNMSSIPSFTFRWVNGRGLERTQCHTGHRRQGKNRLVSISVSLMSSSGPQVQSRYPSKCLWNK